MVVSPQFTVTVLMVPVPGTLVIVSTIDCPRKAVVADSVKLTVGGTLVATVTCRPKVFELLSSNESPLYMAVIVSNRAIVPVGV